MSLPPRQEILIGAQQKFGAPVVGTQLDVLLTAIGNPLAPFGPEFAGASVGTFGDVDTESWAAYIFQKRWLQCRFRSSGSV